MIGILPTDWWCFASVFQMMAPNVRQHNGLERQTIPVKADSNRCAIDHQALISYFESQREPRGMLAIDPPIGRQHTLAFVRQDTLGRSVPFPRWAHGIQYYCASLLPPASSLNNHHVSLARERVVLTGVSISNAVLCVHHGAIIPSSKNGHYMRQPRRSEQLSSRQTKPPVN